MTGIRRGDGNISPTAIYSGGEKYSDPVFPPKGKSEEYTVNLGESHPELAALRALVKATFNGGMTYLVVKTPDGRWAGGKHAGGGVFGG